MGTAIDHLVYATPNLEETMADVERSLGIAPVIGGRHIGRGTWNALISLGDGLSIGPYLELVAPDPTQPAPDGPRPFGVDDITEPTLVTWCMRADDLDSLVISALASGYDAGPIDAMQRATPHGDVLSWRLTMPPREGRGIVPFMIDWGATRHPSLTTPIGASLASFTASHPENFIEQQLHAINANALLSVSNGSPTLRATIRSRHGELTLS